MERYKLYCTESQTRKAFELGAPIEFEMYYPFNLDTFERSLYPDIKMGKDGEPSLINPTAEQMVNWLEEQNIKINIEHSAFENTLKFKIHKAEDFEYEISWGYHYSSRKEATLAAIDAALEYLTNNKK